MTTSINTILKNRKNRKNKKGFSLVELIVVLVIMAILAAALVPTLIGYINQSRQSNSKNECSAAVSAAQTIVSSAYADPQGVFRSNIEGVSNIDFVGSSIVDSAWTTSAAITDTKGADNNALCTAIEKLSEVNSKSGSVTSLTIEKGVVKTMKYEAKNGDVVIYNNGNYSMGS